mmetsp:Transcript_27107/g.62473  ORF Transcript_27107/g.62473 Transcript_27107/m.62473 type:complete len:286 (+) Transcript_27107:145-1002(+)
MQSTEQHNAEGLSAIYSGQPKSTFSAGRIGTFLHNLSGPDRLAGSPKAILSFAARNHFYRELAFCIVNLLRDAQGWDESELWIDCERIGANPDWQAIFQENQRLAPLSLFFLTSQWVQSENCQRELEWFRNQCDPTRTHAAIFIVLEPTLATHPFVAALRESATDRYLVFDCHHEFFSQLEDSPEAAARDQAVSASSFIQNRLFALFTRVTALSKSRENLSCAQGDTLCRESEFSPDEVAAVLKVVTDEDLAVRALRKASSSEWHPGVRTLVQEASLLLLLREVE